uniref:FUSC family protein n=1 Tax=Saccharopolyspora galaxeae TaxID=2781241 RepID=UPI001F2D9E1E|nr:FUSC family protein [Saccharopolyspora sp. HNM0986]
MISEWWNRFLASDPALRRLRNAVRVTAATGLTLLVVLPLLLLWQQPIPVGMVSAVVAINSCTAVNDDTEAERKLTTLLMPIPAMISLALATSTTSLPLLHVGLFLPVVFVATYIRRFGSRYFAFGMVAFMGYFFAMFVRPQLPQLPALALAVVSGALSAYLMRFVVLRDNPRGVLERGRRTLRAQVHGLLHDVRDVAQNPDVQRHRRRLQHRSVRLNETALMLENNVAELPGLDEQGRELLRRRVLAVELAAENTLTPLMRVLDHPSGGGAVSHAIAGLLALVQSDPSEVRAAARSLADRIEREGVGTGGAWSTRPAAAHSGAGSPAHSGAAYSSDQAPAPMTPHDPRTRGRSLLRISGSLDSAVPATRSTPPQQPPDPPDAAEAAAARRPGAAQLAMAIRRFGAALADLTAANEDLGRVGPRTGDDGEKDESSAEEPTETGLQRPEVRAAVQATCAAGIAIVAGQLISPNRWYWAVITAFVVFISARSRGELLVRAWQRTAGTLLGVIAGVLLASRITGDTTAELIMILCCVFLAFYLAGVSYAGLTFFITTMLGALYGILGTFNTSTLGLRLAETAVGAVAGVLAAVFVLPTRTRRLVRQNVDKFLLALRDFLRSAGTDVSSGNAGGVLREDVREVDDALHQALSSARPLVNYRVSTRRSSLDRSMTMLSGCAYAARNLAVALPQAAEMVDEDTRQRLAELLWALAETAEALTDEAGQSFETARESARKWAEDLRDLAESLPQDPTSLHRALSVLDRLASLLDDVRGEISAPQVTRG